MRPVLKLETAPSGSPVTLADVKSHLRIDHPDDDTILQAYINAVVGLFDGPAGRLGRAIMRQTWKQIQERPDKNGDVYIDLAPVHEVTGVSYVNGSDHSVVADDVANYNVLDGHSDTVMVSPKFDKDWPSYARDRQDAIQVTFTAGYENAAAVPDPIKQAIYLFVGHLYQNREATTDLRLREIPLGVEALLEPYKVRYYG